MREIVAFSLITFCLAILPAAAQAPPATSKSPVTDIYHGESVVEDYRWLEDADSPAVEQWTAAQKQYARQTLDNLPHADAIRKQVTEILSAKTVSYSSVTYRQGRFFAVKQQPPKQQPFIVLIDALDALDAARTVVDPNELDPSGSTSIDWYKVSPDGKLIAVSLSAGGSETGDLHVFDVASGKQVEAKIAGVNSGTAGGSLAWWPDSDGFFYTRHFKVDPQDPQNHSVYQQVYRHRLGTSIEDDRYELGKGFPQIAEIQLTVDNPTGRLLATVQKGDGGNFAHYLREPDGNWRSFSVFGDGVKQAVFGHQDDLWVVTLRDAPRGRIVRVPIATLDVQAAATVIAQSEDTIVTGGVPFWGQTTVLPTADRLYVVYQLGGPSELRCFNYDGQALPAPRQLEVSAIHQLLATGEHSILFGNASFTQPNTYYRYDAATDQTTATALGTTSPTRLDDVRVLRRFATSKDGTQIPMNIMLPAGVEPDGNTPCVVYGYGGYGINLEPSFKPLNRILMDRKVIYVVTNLRGGNEYGEQWHLRGNLLNKQNVFDDFAACVQNMTELGYTRPAKTAIMGGSNGGLLMGATLTQHPAIAKAVVSLVGIYDMLRVELSPNGAFNVPEFGSVKDPQQFAALRAYSPYHNVVDGVPYPAVLFITGENDPRVDPMQSRKMTARLQAATSSDEPILLRTSANAGHGRGNSLSHQIEQAVDTYAFLFDELGVR
ncbi:prolyl oligopeptidase family serine peptidase [Roseimaritima ulvae]|uniref:prolyl oligopeptidase n=1 Tax=Roseimaritima ulvae TaxID=980254 RepID=A0A5B9QYN6_9BACT|nr:prolyl oligopeptidase family serine peptidase [Roseimaritima ulvae]QEG42970.1 Prolyl endopeptidase [Roseimaritima ulvae]